MAKSRPLGVSESIIEPNILLTRMSVARSAVSKRTLLLNVRMARPPGQQRDLRRNSRQSLICLQCQRSSSQTRAYELSPPIRGLGRLTCRSEDLANGSNSGQTAHRSTSDSHAKGSPLGRHPARVGEPNHVVEVNTSTERHQLHSPRPEYG